MPVTRDAGPEVSGGEPLAVHPTLAADAAKCRTAVRLSTDYFLRSAQLMSSHANGGLLTAVILRAIVAANTGHLDDDPETSARYASLDSVPPDELRRPVSVLSLSQSLGLPFETTRRHVNKLTQAGFCKRVAGGVVTPAATMRGPAEDQALLANMANLGRLFRALKRVGVVFD